MATCKCGKQFEPKRSTRQIWCSEKCRKRHDKIKLSSHRTSVHKTPFLRKPNNIDKTVIHPVIDAFLRNST